MVDGRPSSVLEPIDKLVEDMRQRRLTNRAILAEPLSSDPERDEAWPPVDGRCRPR